MSRVYVIGLCNLAGQLKLQKRCHSDNLDLSYVFKEADGSEFMCPYYNIVSTCTNIMMQHK